MKGGKKKKKKKKEKGEKENRWKSRQVPSQGHPIAIISNDDPVIGNTTFIAGSAACSARAT